MDYFKSNNKTKESNNNNQDVEENPENNIKIWKYELDRLKYYFAVITFENPEIVSEIYDNFDELEIELTGCTLDLWVVSDDIKFPAQPIEICSEIK